MTKSDDLELKHGATAKARENALKQDLVHAANAIGHHPERLGFVPRTEFIRGTGAGALENFQPMTQDDDLEP